MNLGVALAVSHMDTVSLSMTGKLRRYGGGDCGGMTFPRGPGNMFSSGGYQLRDGGLPGPVLLLV